MLIFAIDDEKAMLTQLHNAIEQAEPGAQIMDFNRAKAALDAISDKGLKPDVVFSDIEMPGMTGLCLRNELVRSISRFEVSREAPTRL